MSTAFSTTLVSFVSKNAIFTGLDSLYLRAPACPPLLCKQEVTGSIPVGSIEPHGSRTASMRKVGWILSRVYTDPSIMARRMVFAQTGAVCSSAALSSLPAPHRRPDVHRDRRAHNHEAFVAMIPIIRLECRGSSESFGRVLYGASEERCSVTNPLVR